MLQSMSLKQWREQHTQEIETICGRVYISHGAWSLQQLGIECDDFKQIVLLELFKKEDTELFVPHAYTCRVAFYHKTNLIRRATNQKVSFQSLFDSDIFMSAFDADNVPIADRVELAEEAKLFRFQR